MKFKFLGLFLTLLLSSCNDNSTHEETHNKVSDIDKILEASKRFESFKSLISGNWEGYYISIEYKKDTTTSNENSDDELFLDQEKFISDTVKHDISFTFDTANFRVFIQNEIELKEFKYTTNHGILEKEKQLTVYFNAVQNNEAEPQTTTMTIMTDASGNSYEIEDYSKLNNSYDLYVTSLKSDSLRLNNTSYRSPIFLAKK